MAIYKCSRELSYPPTYGGGNGLLSMTDEINTVLSAAFTPLHFTPLTHMSFHFPTPPLPPPPPLRMFLPPADVTRPQWLHIVASASHSCTEARKASSVA